MKDVEGNTVTAGAILYVAVTRGQSASLVKGVLVDDKTCRVLYLNEDGYYWRAKAANLGGLSNSVMVGSLPNFIPCDEAPWFSKKHLGTIVLTNFNRVIVDWLMTGTTDEWTLTKSAKEISFKNPDDAVMFKLVMAGETC